MAPWCTNGGLGLGLAIVRYLVELHGGTVEADSPGIGGGATFTIRLPLAVDRRRAQSPKKESGDPWTTESTQGDVEPLRSLADVRVLLVDDDQDSLQLLTTMLSDYGANLQTATSAAEALEVIEWYKNPTCSCLIWRCRVKMGIRLLVN